LRYRNRLNVFVSHVLYFYLLLLATILANQIKCRLAINHCMTQALMRESRGEDYLAVAWQYTGQDVHVIPAGQSRMTRPGWTCATDSDCDDGVWCNGKLI
jgi:hypothetical protein